MAFVKMLPLGGKKYIRIETEYTNNSPYDVHATVKEYLNVGGRDKTLLVSTDLSSAGPTTYADDNIVIYYNSWTYYSRILKPHYVDSPDGTYHEAETLTNPHVLSSVGQKIIIFIPIE